MYQQDNQLGFAFAVPSIVTTGGSIISRLPIVGGLIRTGGLTDPVLPGSYAKFKMRDSHMFKIGNGDWEVNYSVGGAGGSPGMINHAMPESSKRGFGPRDIDAVAPTQGATPEDVAILKYIAVNRRVPEIIAREPIRPGESGTVAQTPPGATLAGIGPIGGLLIAGAAVMLLMRKK